MRRLQQLFDKARDMHDGNSMCNAIYAKDLIGELESVKSSCDLLKLSVLSCNPALDRKAYLKRIEELNVQGTLDALISGLESTLGDMIEENMRCHAEGKAEKSVKPDDDTYDAVHGMDKAVVEMAKSVAAMCADADDAHDAMETIMDAYSGVHAETLRLIAENESRKEGGQQ